MHSPMTPGAWLAQHPLLANERIYAVLGNASEAKPYAAWQSMAAGEPPQSIWAATAYAEWNEVMPYVALVEPGSAFLDWITTTAATDWGWLAVSSSVGRF